MRTYIFISIVIIFQIMTIVGCASSWHLPANNQTAPTQTMAPQTPKDISFVLNDAIDNALSNIKPNSIIALASIIAPNQTFYNFLTYELEHVLVSKQFSVVDRSELDRIRAEQQIQLSGDVDDATAISIGKWAGANVIIIARAEREGSSNRLRIRILDTQTALVIGTASELFTTTLNMISGSINQPTITQIHTQTITPITSPKSTLNVGDIITFGDFEWRVLTIKENRALIITTKIVEYRPYDQNSNKWQTSGIRRWLNYGFYNSFTTTERDRIIEVDVNTVETITKDKIFLLSTWEAENYFSSDSDRGLGMSSDWLLRSPGGSSNVAVVRSSGGVARNGFAGKGIRTLYGIRPALWLSL